SARRLAGVIIKAQTRARADLEDRYPRVRRRGIAQSKLVRLGRPLELPALGRAGSHLSDLSLSGVDEAVLEGRDDDQVDEREHAGHDEQQREAEPRTDRS